MFELPHEANVAYHIVVDNLQMLEQLTVDLPPKLSDDEVKDFSHTVRKSIMSITSAFDVFVDGIVYEVRKKGVFPTMMPPFRKQTIQVAESHMGLAAAFSGGLLSPQKRQRPSAAQDADVAVHREASATSGNVVALPPLTPREGETVSMTKHSTTEAGGSSPLPAAPLATMSPSKPSEAPATGGILSLPLRLGFSGGSGPLAQSSAACNAPNETAEGLVATGIYFLFDALVRQTLAREAALYLYQPASSAPTQPAAASKGSISALSNAPKQVDEAQAICLFGGKPRPPINVRIPLKTGVVGAVLRSGYAVNIVPEHAHDANPYLLCVPVFPVGPRTAPIGAVVLEKKASNAPFTNEDESLTVHWAQLAAQLLTQYNVVVGKSTYFDPYRTLMKKTSPLAQFKRMGFSCEPVVEHVAPVPMAGGSNAAVSGGNAAVVNLMNSIASAHADLLARGKEAPRGTDPASVAAVIQSTDSGYSAKLATLIATHATQQFVFRAVHHNHFTTARGMQLGGSGSTLQTQNVVDVAEYVSSMEECWKRAAEDLQVMETEQVTRMDDFRNRKKKLKATQQRCVQLEGVCDGYKNKYEALRRELTVLCGAPVDTDVGGGATTFGPSSSARDGGPGRGRSITIGGASMGGGNAPSMPNPTNSSDDDDKGDPATFDFSSAAIKKIGEKRAEPLNIQTKRHLSLH